jgi:hypothetical protein
MKSNERLGSPKTSPSSLAEWAKEAVVIIITLVKRDLVYLMVGPLMAIHDDMSGMTTIACRLLNESSRITALRISPFIAQIRKQARDFFREQLG